MKRIFTPLLLLLVLCSTANAQARSWSETIRRGFDAYPRFDNGMFWHSARIRQVWAATL